MFNLFLLNEIYTNGFFFNWLNVISIISIICGISVIVAKNPVISVLYLIGLFFSIASYLMMLGLNFIGLSYLLVYVGAVSILFLFILMLINVRISELLTDNNNSFILAFMVGVLLFIPVYDKGNVINTFKLQEYINNYKHYSDINILARQNEISLDIIKPFTRSFALKGEEKVYGDGVDSIFLVTSKLWDGVISEVSHITTIGNVIYTSYPLWLILTSIILLLAMVGAIIITIKK